MDNNQKPASALKNFITGSLRFRNVYIFSLTAAVLIAFIAFDPDTGLLTDLGWGATTIATFLILMKAVPGITLLHISRKALTDYIDIEEIYKKVMADESSTGAGLFMVGIGLMLIAIASIIAKVV